MFYKVSPLFRNNSIETVSDQTNSGTQSTFQKLINGIKNIRAKLFGRDVVHPQTQEMGRVTSLSNSSQRIQSSAVKVVNLLPKLSPMQIDLNTNAIIQGIRQAAQAHSGEEHLMIHTSEMSITGYCCGDLHQITNKEALNGKIQGALRKIMNETHGISVTVGFPYYNEEGKRVILHALISNGEIKTVKGKEELANNIGRNRGVEYEVRFFVPCEAGMKFNLLGHEYTYETGTRSLGNLFSDEPVEIAGKKVSLVICEEMFTGTDQMGPLYNKLGEKINKYLKQTLESAVPKHYIEINQAYDLMSQVETALNADSLVLPRLEGFNEEEVRLLNEEFGKTFADFKVEYAALKKSFDQKIKEEIVAESRLYKQLEKADIVLVPNGSPSASHKLEVREGLLQTIGDAYREKLGENEVKTVFYCNHNGIQGGSVAYDGTVLKTTLTKEETSVQLLSTHAYGLIDEPRAPHWATKAGRKEIADTIDNSKIYAGQKATVVKFGNRVTDVYTKFYNDTEYAYSSLMDLLKFLPDLKPGQMIPKGEKTFSGYFVSQSGGFDSGHTAIVLAKSIERRLRTLYKENPDGALNELKKELKLAHRPFDIDIFCARFLTARVNTSENLDNTALTYKNLEVMAQILGINQKITEDNVYVVIEQVRGKLSGVNTVSGLLDLLKRGVETLPVNDQLEYLSKLAIFHVVKAAYLRTDNNSIDTENAARSLDVELGIDFEVRNVDVDFKTELLLEKGINLLDFDEIERIKILEKYSEILSIGKKSKLEEQIEQKRAAIEIINYEKTGEETAELEESIAEAETKIKEDGDKLARLKGELYQLVQSKLPVGINFTVHNWFESSTGLEIENIQARLRAQLNWHMANEYGFVPTSNPNADESKQGYTTVSGDLHAGLISETGQHRKTGIYAEMLYLMKSKMHDAAQYFGEINIVKAIYNTFKQPPSAELQQLSQEKKSKGAIQQTDEDSYGMSYPELSEIGDKLFELNDNGAGFSQMCDIYANHFNNDLIFHGHNKWEIFSKMDKVNRQWYAASFKRRSAPWQMTNSDSAVDHHANSRTEFAGNDNAIKFERTALLLTLLVEQKIIKGAPLKDLLRNLLLNSDFQEKLQKVLWVRGGKPDDLKELIKLYKGSPGLLQQKITERVVKAGIKLDLNLADLEIKNPPVGEIAANNGSPVIGKPIATRARDLAGNVEKAKKAIVEAVQAGKEIVVIPDLVGADLGDNVRRVSPEHLKIMLDELAKFSSRLPIAVIAGHPTFDEATKDRSLRYYQSASVIQGGEVRATFSANKINNNHDKPGTSYDTRTFQPFKGPQEPVVINGKSYFIAIGESGAPAGSVNIIHLGAMEAEDQLAVAAKHGDRLAGSFNAVGSSSGIRSFNGRSIYSTREIAGFEEQDAAPDAGLLQDARYGEDYLPWGKVTVSLDSPESLYTLAVLKKRIEMKKGSCDQKTFLEFVDVVTPYYEGENVDELWNAARDVLGFELPVADSKHPTNKYKIDSIRYMFVRNALVGDINMKAFAGIKENDSWLTFDTRIKAFLNGGQAATTEQLREFHALLTNSAALKASLKETYRRELLNNEKNFEAYAAMQIRLMVNRIRDYQFSSEPAERMRAISAWLLSARDGGEGQIMVSNIARNDLCCSQDNWVGSRLNEGGLSFTASRSLKEMKEAIKGSQLVNDLFDKKMGENIADGLTRKEVDEIYEYIKDHNFDISGIEELKWPQLIKKLETFAVLWKKNNLDRHCIPNTPHSKYSVDQQTSFREPMLAGWLDDQLLLLKQKMRAQVQSAPRREHRFFSCFRPQEATV